MNEWKLTSLDTFCLGMVIKGAWVYRSLPSFDELDSALRKLLAMYPQLLGLYDEEKKAVAWDETASAPICFKHIECQGHSVSENPYKLVRRYDINGFKKGKIQPFSANLLSLDDGAVLVLQCAHACMDGYSFYSFVRQWADLVRGSEVHPMTVNQNLIPRPDFLSKEDTLERVQGLAWPKIGFRQLVRMLRNLAAMSLIRKAYVLEVSQEELSEMRRPSGVGTNAVLCSLAARRLLEHLPEQESFSLLEVADLRGRACGVPSDFMGNFSQPVVVGSYGTDAPADQIHKDVAYALAYEGLSDSVQLSICASEHGLPYHYFDASDMNSPKPKLFYVNNQLKFRACETDFGTGLPLRALQAELPDMIKFWQETPDGPVQIIYGGNAARLMRKKR